MAKNLQYPDIVKEAWKHMMLQIIQSPSLPLFTSLVLLVVLAIYWKRFRSHTCPIDLRLPPGPWKLHLIGNLHQLAGSLQHHCLTDLAKKPLSLNGRPALIAAEIFSYNCAGLIFVPDNDHWREMRKLLRYVTGLKPASEKIHRKMDRILEEVINDHRKKRKAAFALLTNKNNKESCHQEEVEDLVEDLYFAGSETAASTTEWAMSELVRNPRAMEKAQAEVRQVVAGLGNEKKLEDADMKKLDYLKMVIKETL
ncbi:unnamed protein product [Prunus armeniaca]|uniref:Cytochrome P450 n=1 Tax=Prunus armeniaca TaxID=36596 RepID=A0A6J5XT05_PRUAR|nr:unnamed protein product [Prunus armeniaca]